MMSTDPNEPAAGVGFSELTVEEVAGLLASTQAASASATPATAEAAAPRPSDASVVTPVPIVLPKRTVSGRYRSGGTSFRLELRVDVDGSRPMLRLSGDFFSVSGATISYFGSFVVNPITLGVTASTVTIEGVGQYTYTTAAPRIRVTIPRVVILQPPAAATAQFFRPDGAAGATYACPWASRFFRSVQWEQDSVAGTVPFISYNTGSLPQPPTSPARVLTVPGGYAEAGIEIQVSGTPNIIATGAAGSDAKWDDSELHAAMVANFSLFANQPQWKVWLLVATQHVGGYRGIMFDYSDGFQRQGCAVFYNAIQGADAASQRAQLRTYVHELGHCFNLLHSWQKNLANPPAPLGPNGGFGDLSWMNYTWRYQPPPPAPGGDAAYWTDFPFQFTDNEVVHLRHGFYRNVIIGAEPFGKGAAEVDPEIFADRVEDRSGLRLELRGRPTVVLGEPVVVELKLSTTDTRGRQVHRYLHPNATLVQIAILKPGGTTMLYRPLMQHCADDEKTTILNADQPAIYSSAYIGYGRDGFVFEQPGVYGLRAIYMALDGSRIVSQTFRLRVRSALTPQEEEIAGLYFGPEQGQLFYLLGSDSEQLKTGNDALELVADKHTEHPLAVYAKLALGVNASRDFKTLSADKKLTLRKAKPQETTAALGAVIDQSEGDQGIDNITLNMVLRRLAGAEFKTGDIEKGNATLDRMVDIFRKKKVNSNVLRRVQAQARAEKRDVRRS
jgi:hypothetical protein